MHVDVDTVVRRGLAQLALRPGVQRACLALVEGGGRRLSFTASDRDGPAIDWCHIDAYDDAPLNLVVRTCTSVVGSWDELAPQFPDFVARQVDGPASGLVAEPLVAHEQVFGAVLVYVDGLGALTTLGAEGLGSEALTRALRAAQSRGERPDGSLSDIGVGPGALVADCAVEGEASAVGIARRFLRRELSAWGIDDDIVDASVLCLSELITNAVIHTGAPCEVRAVLEGDVLTVMVRDRGTHRGARPSDGNDLSEDPLRVHGRGLQLVAALSSRWGSELDAVGTTVWFVMDGADSS